MGGATRFYLPVPDSANAGSSSTSILYREQTVAEILGDTDRRFPLSGGILVHFLIDLSGLITIDTSPFLGSVN